MHHAPHHWLKVSSLAICAALFGLGSLSACSGGASGAAPLPTATTGTIQIAVSRSQFAAHDPVGATLTNTSDSTFYAMNGRSACTFFQLQEFNSSKHAWVNVVGCAGVNPTPLEISPRLTEPFTLAPTSSTDPNSWDPGTYRIVLAYGTSASGSDASTLAFSSGFTIVSG
jgi:hypothetical protein